MKKTFVLIFMIIAVIACNNKKDNQSAETQGSASINAEKIYKSNCTLCHGDNGKLGLNNSKDLTVSELSLEERVDIITNGKNTMVGFSSLLDEDEIKAVAEYTFTLK